jgi:AraC-like DNA-binding protein
MSHLCMAGMKVPGGTNCRSGLDADGASAFHGAWSMALAKEFLRNKSVALDEVERRVGYGSASTFSTAFSRHVGQPPGRYARAGAGEAVA